MQLGKGVLEYLLTNAPKMQLPCNSPTFLQEIDDFLAKTPLNSSPKGTAAAFLLHF